MTGVQTCALPICVDATTAGYITTDQTNKYFYGVLDVYRWSSDTLTKNGYTYILILKSYQISNN